MEEQGSWRNVNCRKPESGFEFPEVVRLNKNIVVREKQNIINNRKVISLF